MKINRKDNELLTRSFGCTIKAINEERRSVDVIMSTDTVDRYGERVEQDWDLDPFSKNPVCLWAHMSRELPIGRVENARIEAGALRGTIVFASKEANPLAEQCLQLFRERVLNAVSVGFIAHSYRLEMTDDEEIFVLYDNELVELSVTPTPANPEALARMKAMAREEAAQSRPPVTTPANAENPKKTDQTAEKDSQAERKRMDLEQKLAALEVEKATLATQVAQLNGQVTQLGAQCSQTTQSLDTEKAKTDALTTRCATLETERGTLQARAEKAEGELVARDIDALVGVKITAAEKPSLVKLASKAPDLYAEQLVAIKARPDMKMLETVVAADPNVPASSAGEPVDSGDALLAEVNKSLKASAA